MLEQRLADRIEGISSLDSFNLFFIGGYPKSGTTWVERIFDAHPEASCKGEAHFISLLEPSLRHAIVDYNRQVATRGNWSLHNRSGSTRVNR